MFVEIITPTNRNFEQPEILLDRKVLLCWFSEISAYIAMHKKGAILKDNPNIYLFNPTCEYAVANAMHSWQPNRSLQKMEADLATLPMFLSYPEDHILVDQLPAEQFLDEVQQLHFASPHFKEKRQALSKQKYIETPKNKLIPWGWSPAAHKLLAPLKSACSVEFKRSPVFEWKPEYRNYYSKKYALGILRRVLVEFPDKNFMEEKNVGRVCTTKTEIKNALKDWRQLMVKAPWSSSGRGLQPITKTPIHEKVWEKLLGIINEQGYAMVEPLLDKQLDIAFQFYVKDGRVSFLGISNFTTDEKGQYQGNHLNGLPDSLDSEVRLFAEQLPQSIVEPLLNILESSELARNYEGNLGVDALIFRDEQGKLRVNPCLEINVRQNMGLLSLQLEKFLVPGQKGLFRTWYGGGSSFLDFKLKMQQMYPLILQNSRIRSGFMALNEARPNTQFGAYLLV